MSNEQGERTTEQHRWRVCYWAEDEEGWWQTRCGDGFTFYESGPFYNSFKFCPYCAKPIREVPFKW